MKNFLYGFMLITLSNEILTEKCETGCQHKYYSGGFYNETINKCRCFDDVDVEECIHNRNDFKIVKAPRVRKDSYTRYTNLFD